LSTKVFDKYVRDRVEEERREKKNRMRELREQFTKLLEEAGVSTRTTYNDFSIKNGKDERFKAIEKTR
jgi:transcription elongation regulator 1